MLGAAPTASWPARRDAIRVHPITRSRSSDARRLPAGRRTSRRPPARFETIACRDRAEEPPPASASHRPRHSQVSFNAMPSKSRVPPNSTSLSRITSYATRPAARLRRDAGDHGPLRTVPGPGAAPGAGECIVRFQTARRYRSPRRMPWPHPRSSPDPTPIAAPSSTVPFPGIVERPGSALSAEQHDPAALAVIGHRVRHAGRRPHRHRDRTPGGAVPHPGRARECPHHPAEQHRLAARGVVGESRSESTAAETRSRSAAPAGAVPLPHAGSVAEVANSTTC